MKKQMNTYLLALTLYPATLLANSTRPCVSVEGRAEVRIPNVPGRIQHQSFNHWLEDELELNRTYTICDDHPDYILKYHFFRQTVNPRSVMPQGDVKVQFIHLKTLQEKTMNLSCPVEINDGGNRTLKPRCAKKIIKLLENN